MSKLSSIFDGASGLVGKIGEAIDRNITSEEERIKLKAEFAKINSDFQINAANIQAELIKAEMSGNRLQRSWRPVLFLSFGAIVCYEYFFATVFNLPKANLPSDFWDLLCLGIGGGVIGRTAEKISASVSENLDKIGKKK